MTRNDKILLTFCFILGCIVTFFGSGCSKPSQKLTIEYRYDPQYPLGDYLDTLPVSEAENKLSEKIVVYTSLNENNEPVKMASCKGCHFVCPKCVE